MLVYNLVGVAFSPCQGTSLVKTLHGHFSNPSLTTSNKLHLLTSCRDPVQSIPNNVRTTQVCKKSRLPCMLTFSGTINLLHELCIFEHRSFSGQLNQSFRWILQKSHQMIKNPPNMNTSLLVRTSQTLKPELKWKTKIKIILKKTTTTNKNKNNQTKPNNVSAAVMTVMESRKLEGKDSVSFRIHPVMVKRTYNDADTLRYGHFTI